MKGENLYVKYCDVHEHLYIKQKDFRKTEIPYEIRNIIGMFRKFRKQNGTEARAERSNDANAHARSHRPQRMTLNERLRSFFFGKTCDAWLITLLPLQIDDIDDHTVHKGPSND